MKKITELDYKTAIMNDYGSLFYVNGIYQEDKYKELIENMWKTAYHLFTRYLVEELKFYYHGVDAVDLVNFIVANIYDNNEDKLSNNFITYFAESFHEAIFGVTDDVEAFIDELENGDEYTREELIGIIKGRFNPDIEYTTAAAVISYMNELNSVLWYSLQMYIQNKNSKPLYDQFSKKFIDYIIKHHGIARSGSTQRPVFTEQELDKMRKKMDAIVKRTYKLARDSFDDSDFDPEDTHDIAVAFAEHFYKLLRNAGVTFELNPSHEITVESEFEFAGAYEIDDVLPLMKRYIERKFDQTYITGNTTFWRDE